MPNQQPNTQEHPMNKLLDMVEFGLGPAGTAVRQIIVGHVQSLQKQIEDLTKQLTELKGKEGDSNDNKHGTNSTGEGS